MPRRLIGPLQRFLHVEAAGGVVLLTCALVALLWANSPWASSYEALWHHPLGVRLWGVAFFRDLHFWIDDGLMVIFFFVVGLEIRRELSGGELSELRRAALPVVAAVGGMVAPALIYWALNPSGPASRGWGVPTATDIAFAVGVLALLGQRVPPALRLLLLSLAIIDDIGAILVIALFYSSGIAWGGLAIAVGGVLGIVLFQRLGVERSLAYLAPALVIWIGLLRSGVHPTIGGVIVGLLTPAAPLARLESLLHPWVAYAIMPLFALANAGVAFGAVDLGTQGSTTIALGVVLGLVLGKPLGITLTSLLAVRLGLCVLPDGVGKKELLVVGSIAGIGFTMSLFVAQLAFSDPATLGTAKLAVLVGSGVAGAAGLGLGWVLLGPYRGRPASLATDPSRLLDQPR